MANTVIIADSVAGIPADLAQKYGIRIVPAANIMFNGESYIDGVTITPALAYQMIRKNPDRFITAAITPGYLLEVYREVAKKTDNILFITISGELSAVSRTANLAAQQFREESPKTTVRVFDSRTVAGGEGLIVLAAAKAAAKGMNINDIIALAEKVRAKTGMVMLLDTLRYIYRTGRMSRLGYRIAAALNIKPLNKVTPEGTIELANRSRKHEVGVQQMMDLIKQEAGTNALHFMIMHADAPDYAQELRQRFEAEFKVLSLIISDFSPVMGYGGGPKSLCVGFRPDVEGVPG